MLSFYYDFEFTINKKLLDNVIDTNSLVKNGARNKNKTDIENQQKTTQKSTSLKTKQTPKTRTKNEDELPRNNGSGR